MHNSPASYFLRRGIISFAMPYNEALALHTLLESAGRNGADHGKGDQFRSSWGCSLSGKGIGGGMFKSGKSCICIETDLDRVSGLPSRYPHPSLSDHGLDLRLLCEDSPCKYCFAVSCARFVGAIHPGYRSFGKKAHVLRHVHSLGQESVTGLVRTVYAQCGMD